MSYDLDLGDKEEFNITYNVAYMFYDLDEKGIRIINGNSGASAFYSLTHFRNNIELKHDEFVALQPENGWGTVERTLEILNQMILKSLQYPNEIWKAE